MKLLIVLLCAIVAISATQKSYQDYKVYRVTPTYHSHLNTFKEWQANTDIDFWEDFGIGRTSRVMVSPELDSSFVNFLVANEIKHELIIPDVEKTLVEERKIQALYANQQRKAGSRSSVEFNHFFTLEEIYDLVDELQVEFPNLISSYVADTTAEGRDIRVVKISTGGGGTKPVILIDGGLHAREWAGVMSVVYLMHELVEHASEHADMLDNVDYVIVPVANPDGYSYSHTNDRFWRKNRVVNPTGTCLGVDLNRNFNYRWLGGTNTCSLTYPGPSGNSEIETRVMDALMAEYASRIKMYLAVHTYGQYILYPWGYDFVNVDNWELHQAIGSDAARDIQVSSGRVYAVGNSAALLYTASGCSDDYAIGAHSIELAYTLELTGGGSQGFDLPPQLIMSVAGETFVAYRVFARYVAANSN